MGFAIEISEVGPAEYPLIDVLRRTLANEHREPSPAPVGELLEGRSDILVLIAHLEGNPVGYLSGRRGDGETFHPLGTGVLKDYREQGIEQRLHEWMTQFAASRQLTIPVTPS